MKIKFFEAHKSIDTLTSLEVYKSLLTIVQPYAGREVCNTVKKGTTVYGFFSADHDLDFWFARKQDAEFAAQWLRENEWDGMGDLEMILQDELSDKWFASDRSSSFPELGKCYF